MNFFSFSFLGGNQSSKTSASISSPDRTSLTEKESGYSRFSNSPIKHTETAPSRYNASLNSNTNSGMRLTARALQADDGIEKEIQDKSNPLRRESQLYPEKEQAPKIKASAPPQSSHSSAKTSAPEQSAKTNRLSEPILPSPRDSQETWGRYHRDMEAYKIEKAKVSIANGCSPGLRVTQEDVRISQEAKRKLDVERMKKRIIDDHYFPAPSRPQEDHDLYRQALSEIKQEKARRFVQGDIWLSREEQSDLATEIYNEQQKNRNYTEYY